MPVLSIARIESRPSVTLISWFVAARTMAEVLRRRNVRAAPGYALPAARQLPALS